ncbi:prolipoprotein diacylglyceryl transferase family protein [Aquisalimonas sp. APHAB1-3]|uniref:prolipoprotein diacylglyceryl transferase family protein n=1 Tax=Aquisalimonas sp. APHAB1-3 TaxID=3402080 RepID=UPI003AAA4F81
MESVTLGPLVISLPRLFLILSVVAAFVVASWWERRRDVALTAPLTAAVVAGFLGGRAVYVVQHWSYYRDAPVEMLYLWQEGYSAAAGIAIALVAAVLLGVWRRAPQRHLLAPLLTGAVLWFGLNLGAAQFSDTSEHPIPDIVVYDLDDQPLALNSFTGKPVVVNLWATWCPPCRREMPVLESAQSQRDDIHFVFANQGESPDDVAAYLDEEGLGLENVVLDQASRVADHFGAHGMPVTLFFNSQGQLVDAHMGEVSGARLHQYLQDIDG